jgi:hypothetical protein
MRYSLSCQLPPQNVQGKAKFGFKTRFFSNLVHPLQLLATEDGLEKRVQEFKILFSKDFISAFNIKLTFLALHYQPSARHKDGGQAFGFQQRTLKTMCCLIADR